MKQLALSGLALLVLLVSPSWARQESLTPEEKQKLEKIDKVLIEVIALSDKGSTDAGPFREVVSKRLQEFGYTVVTDSAQPHDVTFNVKCEQHKIWEGTTKMGSDADLPDSPSRLWKGPACQLSYLLDGKRMAWRKEVRTDFADAQQAAEAAHAGDPSDYAMSKLKERLEDYDFPALITAGMVKPGAAVLDVGVSRVDGKIAGDVALDVVEVAGHVAPNPGGVGPMTRAMLLQNVVLAAERAATRQSLPA